MRDRTWSQLHDLALLYLACMHGADEEIDKSEMAIVRQLLAKRRHREGVDVSGVMDDAMLMYVGSRGGEMLATSVAALRETMDNEQRMGVLQDLADIASADGLIYPGEVQFISEIAREWGLEGYFS